MNASRRAFAEPEHTPAMNKRHSPPSLAPRRIAAPAVWLGAALLAGCSVLPQPITDTQRAGRVQQDQQLLYAGQEAVTGPIALDEAVARALKYNLDHRLKLMESALSAGLADVSRYDMLPRLVASAGYSQRNNDSGGTSVNIDTGAVSLQPSTSQERQRDTAAAELSWNVLDFGVSYYRARQQADQVLIAEERRRRVVHNIVLDVRSAYWRAVGAQRLQREADTLAERARGALERSREAEKQGLMPARDALNYQRQMLDAVASLSTRRQELALARLELRALMNLPAGAAFTLVEADEPELRALPADPDALEEQALRLRPELREEDYRARITALEARRQLLALLPGIQFNAGVHTDSNRYLANNRWLDSGATVGLNLLKLLSLPALQQSQATQVRTDEARRLALSMAVVTQVRVSFERYRLALQDLAVARESAQVDQRLASHARAGLSARADAELELIRAETRALNSAFLRHAAFAAAQTAFGRIVNSVGLQATPEVMLENTPGADIRTLALQVRASLQSVESTQFPQVAAVAVQLPPLRVTVQPVNEPGVDLSQVAAAVQQALLRNHIPPAGDAARMPADAASGPPPVPTATLDLTLVLQPAQGGLRRAEFQLALLQADGSRAVQERYVSVLPATLTPRAMAAFGEAAAVAHLASIEKGLRSSRTP